jgi:hypothetical protein
MATCRPSIAAETGRPLQWVFCLLTVALFLLPGMAAAQLSPGKLSSAHADLDGVTRCTSCHQLGSRDVTGKCLECHTEIQAMLTGGRGLHGRGQYDDCAVCHVEHQGEDFDLVHWPDGQAAFDHAETGHVLEGRHAALECRRCHNARYLPDAEAVAAAGKRLDRTFLGLDNACAACHADIHRGQFPQGCAECHDQDAFRPARGFDHQASTFPLTGRHVQADCAGCHRTEPAPPPEPRRLAGALPASVAAAHADSLVRYRPIDTATCASCHADPHTGTLGPDCASCHITDDWKRLTGQGFDHDRTRYPLRGRHRGLDCARCHGQARARPAFAACADCHRDEHGAMAAGRPALLQCASCHTVDGFAPSTYTIARHQEGAFPLAGAHLATPCLMCHRKPAEAAPAALVIDHAACMSCHRDPHRGRMDRLAPAPDAGCAACHSQQSWRVAGFDHGRTGYPLTGRHAAAACAACHRGVDRADFTGLATACASCHQDVHRGQFAARVTADGAHVDCAACHVTTDWFAERFDHDRDSRFPLRGGHERTACTACHRPVDAAEPGLLHFKPLPVECRDCHTGAVPAPGAKE